MCDLVTACWSIAWYVGLNETGCNMRGLVLGSLVVLVAMACGETSHRGKPKPAVGFEGGRDSHDQVDGGAGDDDHVDVGGRTANGGKASAGAPAAGGERNVVGVGGAGGAAEGPLYDFVLIPALPTPAVPPSDAQPGDEISFDVTPSNASADGKVIFGNSETFYRHVNSSAGAADEALFAWTAATGSQRIASGRPAFTCVASDGSSALFEMIDGQGSFQIWRWTRDGGLVPLVVPPGFHDAYLGTCAADATRAEATAASPKGTRPLYWQLGKNQNAFVEAFPGPAGTDSYLSLSADGTAALLSVTGLSPTTSGYYLWHPDSAPTELVPPTDYRCDSQLISADGKVIVGSCYGNKHRRIFRWTLDGGLVLLEPSDVGALMLSADGNTLLAVDGYTSKLMVFTGETLTHTAHLQPNASYVSYNASADFAVILAGAEAVRSHPAVFTQEGMVRALPVLPELPFAEVKATANEGAIAIGAASPNDTPTFDVGVAVVWDQIGMRDIAAELVAAHVDLKQAGGLVAERVWVDDRTIRIEGPCWTENQFNQQVFVATLPRR